MIAKAKHLETPHELLKDKEIKSRHRKLRQNDFMGRNCNPMNFQKVAWYGGPKQQVAWARNNGIRFFSNELHLPIYDRIPFEHFVTGVQFRHPIKRYFSLYMEDLYNLCDVYYPCSLRGSDVDVWKAYEEIASRNKNSTFQLHRREHRSLSDADALRFEQDTSKHHDTHKVMIREPPQNSGTNRSFSKITFFQRGRNRTVNIGTRPLPSNIKPVHRKRSRNVPSLGKWGSWLRDALRSQDVGFFAGRLGCDRDSNPNYLQHCAENKNYNESSASYAKFILEQFSFVSLLEGAVFSLLNVNVLISSSAYA
jgi:hypothetical protein